MSTRVMLTVTSGPLKGAQFAFERPTVCTVGRAADCQVSLTAPDADLTASRRHCLLEIDPPAVWVKDLNSRNGTYVNGKIVINEHSEDRSGTVIREGDEVKVGCTVFVVGIEERAEDSVEDSENVASHEYAECC